MVAEVPGSDDGYKSTYHLEGKSLEVWKGFWQNLFKDTDLKTSDVEKMTDSFVKSISHQMSHVLDHALKVQKAIRKADESGGPPEAV